ncbi:hypothetical protein [Streptacidiphilus neutrinimicus]|uniref:hypothetical protein n=1 Tax=Streptacidiphilus neutrinimicus TaxID=105420 RepID=UPI0005A9BD24|nr:hypothetical protein [Streptacidiphilus neutrinimicus]
MNRLRVFVVLVIGGRDGVEAATDTERHPVHGRGGAATAGVGALLALFAACGCAANPSATAPTRTAATRSGQPVATAAAAAAYVAIANPANHRLDTDFDRFDGPDRGDLARARTDLRDIAATEHAFDQDLARLELPPAAVTWAQVLVGANEARAALTSRAAANTALPQLNALRPVLSAMNAPVERAVTALRADLRLPPPDTH